MSARRPSPGRAPWLGRLFLKLGVPRAQYEDISGDLEEVFARRVEQVGRSRASGEFLFQSLRVSLRFFPRRVLGLGRSGRPGATRSLHGWPLFAWIDWKLGLRMAVRNPGITLVAGLALAGGIGLSTAGFSFIYSALYSGLPIPNAERVVGIRPFDRASGDYGRATELSYRAMSDALRSFQRVEAFRTTALNVGSDGVGGDIVPIAEITAGSFVAVPVAPLHGRVLHPDDERLGAPPVVVLGYDLWTSRFGADAGVVGERIRVGGRTAEVVGIMPEGFAFPFSQSAWIPLVLESPGATPSESLSLTAFGVLAEGASIEEANIELEGLSARLASEYPDRSEDTVIHAVPFQNLVFRPNAKPAFLLMLGAVLLALLVACANVANLILARAASRTSEIAVRSALGARRGRIVAQLFIEALVLSVIGAVVGVLGARFALRWADGVTLDLPFWIDFELHWPTLLFVVGVTILSAAVAGIAPGFRASGVDLQGSLKANAGGGGSLRFGRLSRALIVLEVVFSVAFLGGAVLTGRSLVAYARWDSGLQGDRILTARIQIPPPEDGRAFEQGRMEEVYRSVESALRRLPGVESVAFADRFPGELRAPAYIELDDGASPDGGRLEEIHRATVSPGYFEALDIVAIRGRVFDRADLDSEFRPALVNEPFVREVLGGQSPLGLRIRPSYRPVRGGDRVIVSGEIPWSEVVGVVPDLGMSPGDPDHAAGVYFLARPGYSSTSTFALRTTGDPHDLSQPLRDAVARVDPTLIVYEAVTLDELGDAAVSLFTAISVAFLVLASTTLFLTVAGLYALIAFSVARRTREIGVRSALGAGPVEIVRAILGRSATQLGMGLVLGAFVGYGVMRLIAAFPEPIRVQPAGPFMLLGVVVTIGGLGLLACAVPAARALRVRTVDALRDDG